jgi:hypothetical protein
MQIFLDSFRGDPPPPRGSLWQKFLLPTGVDGEIMGVVQWSIPEGFVGVGGQALGWWECTLLKSITREKTTVVLFSKVGLPIEHCTVITYENPVTGKVSRNN